MGHDLAFNWSNYMPLMSSTKHLWRQEKTVGDQGKSAGRATHAPTQGVGRATPTGIGRVLGKPIEGGDGSDWQGKTLFSKGPRKTGKGKLVFPQPSG